MPDPLLSLRRIEKSFSGVQALHPIDLDLRAGDVLGLVGENGAGKSTLIKLLSGVHRPDGGGLTWQGRPIELVSPRQALDAGIATIHQELEYVANLSVAENMLLGEPWPRHCWGGVDWKGMYDAAQQQLTDFGLSLSARRRFDELTSAEKQEIAIASALSRNARLLILDEPTASLSEPEVRRLFQHIERLREQGVAMLYVSHRLDEIFAITNRVAVLRDGRLIAEHATADVTVDRLIQDMVGRSLEQVYPRTRDGALGEPLIELDGVTCTGLFHNVSLQVRRGEIVGLAGLVGAGRSELARAVFGLYGIDAGTMHLGGKPWSPKSPRQALAAGLVYLPEERKRQGLVLDHSLRESVSIGFTDLIARFGLIGRRREESRIREILKTYDIRASSASQPVGTLSGGNQQKAMLARWLERDPQVIILDEPTRGVDVGAKAEIHALIDRLAAAGRAVLMISSDLPELLGMSDRIFVMNRGTIETELRGDQMTEHNIVLAASGMGRVEG
jgi:rhamnose transport system ATP-binding protein